MKKLFSIMLAFILLFSLTSCRKKEEKPAENLSAEQSIDDDDTEEAVIGSLLDWMKDGTYYFKYTAEIQYEGIQAQAKGSVAAQGENHLAETEVLLGGLSMIKSRVFVVDGVTWMVDDINKTVTQPSSATVDKVVNQVSDFSKMEHIGSGAGDGNGKLPYEEYNSEGVNIKFYTDGNKVYAIESTMNGAKAVMMIEESSAKVPANCFELPKDYIKK